MARREQIDAVVSPAEPPGKLRDRHHLDRRDAELCQAPAVDRIAARHVPSRVNVPTCSSYSTCPSRSQPRPGAVGPANASGSTTCDGPCGPNGWDRDAGSGKRACTVIKSIAVESAGRHRRDQRREVAVALWGENDFADHLSRVVFNRERCRLTACRPDAEVTLPPIL